jgi:hypothetical protein
MKIKNNKGLTEQKIISTLKKHDDILRKYKVKKIGLFGSYVRRKQKKHSDIDFVVEFAEPTFDNFMDLAFYLEDLFDRRVDILTPEGVESIRIKEIADDIKRSVIYV